jgi:hypothetical protein
LSATDDSGVGTAEWARHRGRVLRDADDGFALWTALHNRARCPPCSDGADRSANASDGRADGSGAF